MKIYLIRHGEVDQYKNFNKEDEDLNETGIKQAEELRKTIKDIDYDIIISSPLYVLCLLLIPYPGTCFMILKTFSAHNGIFI